MFCPSVKFSSLTFLLEERASRQKAFYYRACKIEQQLHRLIRESVKKLTKLYAIWGTQREVHRED